MWQAFIHRVVQWAVYQVINPEFVRGYIEDSYACIKGRGSDAAAQRLFYFMQQAGRKDQRAAKDEKGRPLSRHYVMKLDTSKFFYRIDHQVSLDLIGKKMQLRPLAYVDHGLVHKCSGRKIRFPFW